MRPTGFPEWATNTSTGIVEPTDAKKQAGWTTSEKPAPQYLNWHQNKVGEGMRYLSYDYLIYDDFYRNNGVRGTLGPSGCIPTGIYPLWNGADITSFEQLDDGSNAVVRHAPSASMTRNFTSDIVIPRGQDCIFEAVVAQRSRGGSGSIVRVGAPPTGSFGNSGSMWYSSTGPSSTWFFNYYPPGQGATSVNMNVIPKLVSSGYQMLSFEKRGSTAVAEIRGLATVTVPVEPQMGQVLIGLNIVHTTGSAEILMDSVKFGIRRS